MMRGTLSRLSPQFPRMFSDLDDDLSTWLDRHMRPMGSWKETGEFLPQTNIAESDGSLEVTVELPGMKPEDFNVEVHDNELWIWGEKQEEKEVKGKTYHRTERRHGEFRRVIALPTTMDTEHIDARYAEGVLTVTVPKAEEVKPKSIEVKT